MDGVIVKFEDSDESWFSLTLWLVDTFSYVGILGE